MLEIKPNQNAVFQTLKMICDGGAFFENSSWLEHAHPFLDIVRLQIVIYFKFFKVGLSLSKKIVLYGSRKAP